LTGDVVVGNVVVVAATSHDKRKPVVIKAKVKVKVKLLFPTHEHIMAYQ